ncbi:hypothetical protein TVAG_143810 [Trichomonas vaginalis G3]|uniref:Uncharacterized protein n=1 Tax=Trichomonas vaginalis (strain ATCC PRA-98 / G3) TaxID=412133 RepID=A2G451_TRIV3|nr:hypothetical protein TVAGG3_0229310 [Trichomonas vaginalis G3]EAX88069.1 hypothetical protein TVAG_143810 [Trichomonas vaginalis G3]KAI5552503.1 hypothetical protein TVAGG3_0229310 [Trichomonas vaginalis G3]|eukprot:XP_001300999.1 hypothetical protein [Trichomonas vaginalis G3]
MARRTLLDDIKTFGYAFRTAFMIPIAFILMILLLILDNDPPSLPLPDGSGIVDCSNIKVTKLYAELNRLKVELHVDDFIQYPKQLALSMIKLRADMDGIIFDYPIKNFWDIKSDLENISFCALQTVAGKINTSLLCDGRSIRSENVVVESIDIFPVGWSRLTFQPRTTGIFYSIFFFNDTILFSMQPPGRLDNLRISPDYVMKMGKDHNAAEQIRAKYGGQMIPKHAILVAADSNTTFNLMIDVLYPFTITYKDINYQNAYVYLPSQRFNHTYLFKNVPGVTTLRNGSYLFEELRIPRSSASTFTQSKEDKNISIGYYAEQLQFLAANHVDFETMRKWYTNATKKPKTVVLDNYTEIFKDEIEKVAKIKVKVINENTSFKEIVKTLESASVFVCGHIKTAVFAPFMPKGSTFIEVPPDTSSCAVGSVWIAKQSSLKHEFIKNSSPCNCTYYYCHLSDQATYNGIKLNDVVSKVQQNM